MADEKEEVDDVCDEAVDRQERLSARPRVPDDPGNGFLILAPPENLDFSSSIPLPTHLLSARLYSRHSGTDISAYDD